MVRALLNEVPEHMAQEFAEIKPADSVYSPLLNEVPEHMAQESVDFR